jgi:hypothetical protein
MTQHYIEIKTVNAKMKRMYDDEFTWTQKGIEKRSNGLHVELRFSDRYGRISWSCTLADGVGGCRFKMIGYSHGYRWSTVRIAVTAEQEARLFAKACEMADISSSRKSEVEWLDGTERDELASRLYMEQVKPSEVVYGPDHIKYDRWGASFSFISKLRIWRMHPDDQICNESCANVLLTEWPGLLDVNNGKTGKIINPETITPDAFEYLVRHYFYEKELS